MSIRQSIAGWIASLEREIAEADQNAKKAQFQAWTRFAQHPDFPQVGEDVFRGWIDNRYLDWTLLTVTLYLRPVRSRFFSRIGPSLRWLFTGAAPIKVDDTTFELAEKGGKGTLLVEVNFAKKNEKVTNTFSIRKRKTA